MIDMLAINRFLQTMWPTDGACFNLYTPLCLV